MCSVRTSVSAVKFSMSVLYQNFNPVSLQYFEKNDLEISENGLFDLEKKMIFRKKIS